MQAVSPNFLPLLFENILKRWTWVEMALGSVETRGEAILEIVGCG
jgi:hypothetical protein